MDEHALPTIQQAMQEARSLLAPVSETPIQDAGVLLAHILAKPRSWVLAHAEQRMSPDQQSAMRAAYARLAERVPLPYILGNWEFHGLDFLVDEHVLIPRPETELLVDTALQWCREHPDCRQAVDVGTGSGCIAISLAVAQPDLVVHATDLSGEALSIASRNADRHLVRDRLVFHRGSLLAGLAGPLDLVCANLPYIPSAECAELEVARHEPRLALDGGPDGLEWINALLLELPPRLAPGGLILLEIEARQAADVVAKANVQWPGAQVQVLQDLARLDRVVCIELSPHRATDQEQ